MSLPKKITPNPLVVTSVELRFENILSGDLFNSIYKDFIETFPKIIYVRPVQNEIDKNLIQINIAGINPKEVIIANNEYIFSLGRNFISMECISEYTLWENYYPFIKEQFEKFCRIKNINKVLRIGVRYASIFNSVTDILTILKLNPIISLKGYEQKEFQTFINTYKTGDYLILLQLFNKAQVNKNNSSYIGALIDIDVSFTNLISYSDDVYNKINEMHNIEKKLFFESLLTADFIKTLNPEY